MSAADAPELLDVLAGSALRRGRTLREAFEAIPEVAARRLPLPDTVPTDGLVFVAGGDSTLQALQQALQAFREENALYHADVLARLERLGEGIFGDIDDSESYVQGEAMSDSEHTAD